MKRTPPRPGKPSAGSAGIMWARGCHGGQIPWDAQNTFLSFWLEIKSPTLELHASHPELISFNSYNL